MEEDDDDDPVAGPTFPYLSIRKFKRFAPWQPIIPFAMKSLTQQTFKTVLSRVFFLNRLTELEEVALAKKDSNEKKDLPKLASMSGWLTWVELFHTFLAWHKSAIAGTPLSYIIHDKDEVTDEDRASEDCNLVDEDLVDTSVLSGVACAHVLKPLVMEGPGWPFVQPFNRKRDGCAAFKALKALAEGRSAVATRKVKPMQ